ncbi:MAG: hypothetical protein AVDCRST_MAG68-1094, partial [uncultured Gemmatimonadetes bacterium]
GEGEGEVPRDPQPQRGEVHGRTHAGRRAERPHLRLGGRGGGRPGGGAADGGAGGALRLHGGRLRDRHQGRRGELGRPRPARADRPPRNAL